MKSSKFQPRLGLALACTALTFSLALCAQAQTFDYFAVFNGANGSGPSTVIQATDGNFYGITADAGVRAPRECLQSYARRRDYFDIRLLLTAQLR